MALADLSNQRVFFFLDRLEGAGAPLHRSTICLVPFFIRAVVCRFASALAWPRIDPRIELAPLNHILMNGFFFTHGFLIYAPVLNINKNFNIQNDASWLI
jgi:hypothetical protein